MIVKSAVLIVSNDDDRVFPGRAISHRAHDLRHVSLPALNVGRRMFVVFIRRPFQTEIRINERNRRKSSGRSLYEKDRERKEMGISRGQKAAGLRSILEVVSP